MHILRFTGTLFAGAIAIALVTQPARAETIVVYGASGNIGSVIVNEALSRGHHVIGVSRDPAKLKFDNKNFKSMAGDVTDIDSFKKITKDADAVIMSVAGAGKDNEPRNTVHAQAARVAVQAFTGASKSPEVIQIGGATTMLETKEAIEAKLPPPAKPGTPLYAMFMGHFDVLQTYRASKIRWSVLTPPYDIVGWSMGKPPVSKRTGRYRTSTQGLVTDANGKSSIDIGDLAVAAVDEAEKHRFVGQRFTVGY
jgi:putative NADH-flavin reductase